MGKPSTKAHTLHPKPCTLNTNLVVWQHHRGLPKESLSELFHVPGVPKLELKGPGVKVYGLWPMAIHPKPSSLTGLKSRASPNPEPLNP